MNPANEINYPFTAIVGQSDMKLALCLIAVQPKIGGVLIYGERGTAKTTAVRALPSLLGGSRRVIELPLNASEDRLAYVKGCVISLLESSYTKRVRVGIISFGGTSARLELPFTSSAELAAERISSLKGGSATPMVQAFAIAANLLDRMRDEDLSVYILSDGRYDRTTTGREDRQVREFGEFLKSRDIPVTLIDAGTGRKTAKRRAVQLAAVLHAAYQPMEGLRIDPGQ